MSAGKLKLFFDFLSQPSRSLYILLKLNGIPFEECQVALRNGEHLTDEFKKNFSKFQKVPFIHHNDFRLAESVAIVRYLTREFGLGDKWYPKDSKKQAKVDEYLEWQHHNIRAHCALFFRVAFIEPLMTGEPTKPEKLEAYKSRMISSLTSLEELFLDNQPYICGNELSIADIFAATEIEQTRVVGFEPTEGRPKLAAWLGRVRSELNPTYDEAHKLLNKLAMKMGAKQMKSKI